MAERYPKITLITPSFNQGQYIEETITSVLEQQYPNLEYFVIDGGSTDDSVSVIKKYEKHLSGWLSEKDRGQSHAINKGWAMSTGTWVNWLNSDDLLQPGALNAIAETASKHPEATCICGTGIQFYDGTDKTIQGHGTDLYPGNAEKTLGLNRIDQPDTFFRRDALEAILPLDERLHYLMDRDLWGRYLLLYGIDNVVQIPNGISRFRLHEASKTVSQQPQFNKERHMWFYALARQTGNIYEAGCLREYSSAMDTQYEIERLTDRPAVNVMKALYYYMTLLADEAYYATEMHKCRRLLRQIRFDMVDKETYQLVEKLRMRAWLPEFLVKAIRVLR